MYSNVYKIATQFILLHVQYTILVLIISFKNNFLFAINLRLVMYTSFIVHIIIIVHVLYVCNLFHFASIPSISSSWVR